MENYINHEEHYDNTGLNGHTLSNCMNAKLSEMCADPRIIEDAQWHLDNLSTTIIGLEAQVKQLSTLLKHYELKEMKRKRKTILLDIKNNK